MACPAEPHADPFAAGLPRRLARLGPGTASMVLAALLVGCGPAPERPARIVLVTLDTLRYDSFAGGDGRATDMPLTVERMRDARIFRRHYATSSSTQPTHASLLTGLHPWEHGVVRNGIVLEPGWSTVPERLAEAGWATAAVVASFPLQRSFGFDQGFDVYHDAFTELGTPQWSEVDVPGRRFFSLADGVTSRALQLLDELDGDRQFLWVHYFDPHNPYGDSERDAGEIVDVTLLGMAMLGNGDDPGLAASIAAARAAYDRDVRFLDRALDRLLARLAADAAEIDTHVLLVSDHGESFGEDGSLGHGKRLTESQVHVPLALLSPRVAAGTSDAPTGSVDVAETLLSLAGIRDGTPTGRDLTREPLPESHVVGMRRTFADPFQEIRTDGRIHLVEGSQFYVVLGARTFKGGPDAVEANDGAPVDAPVAERVRALFGAFDEQLRSATAREVLDPEVQRALQGLGYVR